MRPVPHRGLPEMPSDVIRRVRIRYGEVNLVAAGLETGPPPRVKGFHHRAFLYEEVEQNAVLAAEQNPVLHRRHPSEDAELVDEHLDWRRSRFRWRACEFVHGKAEHRPHDWFVYAQIHSWGGDVYVGVPAQIREAGRAWCGLGARAFAQRAVGHLPYLAVAPWIH